jgi:hypothetical protein
MPDADWTPMLDAFHKAASAFQRLAQNPDADPSSLEDIHDALVIVQSILKRHAHLLDGDHTIRALEHAIRAIDRRIRRRK